MTVSYELLSVLVIIIGQALFIAYKIGKFEEKLVTIENKQEKHNNFIERLTIVEQSTKSAHNRIDDLNGGKQGK